MFQFVQQDQWPPLAWLAKCEKSNPTIIVFHGPRVEVCDEWFCEAVWDGEFQNGNFDQTDIVAGSGGRARGAIVKFVSAGNTVDRLQSIEIDATTWVSNSLPCLLSAANAGLDPTYRDYYVDVYSIINGLDKYKRTIKTSAGEVQLTYHDNLVWNGAHLKIEPKPGEDRIFESFSIYRRFLDACFRAIAANMAAPERHFPLHMLGTLSSGYDSTAVSTLAKEHGLREVVTFGEARGGGEDSGEATAQFLGLTVNKVQREAWRATDFPEVPFIASYSSAEDIIFKGVENALPGSLLISGYQGDWTWSKSVDDLSDRLPRKDPSGLSLTEYRLWTGFIHCPVPFWGARRMRDIYAISNSDEMKAWDVPGDYSRPIPRRIAEEAGIPRESFGIRKKAVTLNPFCSSDIVRAHDSFLTPRALTDYLGWIKRNRGAWLKEHQIPPIASSRLNYVLNKLHVGRVDSSNSLRLLFGLWRVINYQSYEPKYLNRHLIPWATDRAKERYAM